MGFWSCSQKAKHSEGRLRSDTVTIGWSQRWWFYSSCHEKHVISSRPMRCKGRLSVKVVLLPRYTKETPSSLNSGHICRQRQTLVHSHSDQKEMLSVCEGGWLLKISSHRISPCDFMNSLQLKPRWLGWGGVGEHFGSLLLTVSG